MEASSAPAWAVWGSCEPAPLRGGVGENVCGGGRLPQPGASARDHVSLRGTDERPSEPPLKAPPCKIKTVIPRPAVILFNDTDRVSLRTYVSRGGGTEPRNNRGSPTPWAGLVGQARTRAVAFSCLRPHGFHPWSSRPSPGPALGTVCTSSFCVHDLHPPLPAPGHKLSVLTLSPEEKTDFGRDQGASQGYAAPAPGLRI